MTTRDAAPERLEARRKIDEQIAKDRANLERRDKRRGIRPNMGPGFLSQDGARAYGTCLRVLDAARRRGARSLRITVHNSVIEFEHDVPADPPGEVRAAKPASGIGDSHAGTEREIIEIKSLDGEDTASTIDAALTAGRYMPLSISLNGTPIERRDFIRGADRIETVENPKIGVVRIGVWLPLSTSRPAKRIHRGRENIGRRRSLDHERPEDQDLRRRAAVRSGNRSERNRADASSRRARPGAR